MTQLRVSFTIDMDTLMPNVERSTVPAIKEAVANEVFTPGIEALRREIKAIQRDQGMSMEQRATALGKLMRPIHLINVALASIEVEPVRPETA